MRHVLTILGFLLLCSNSVWATNYFLNVAANGASDSNNGLSAGSPWLTPNHAVNCGDVITAAISSAYDPANFGNGKWGIVTPGVQAHCVAWVICATFDGCKIVSSAGAYGVWISASHWGIQGFEATTTGGNNFASCFNSSPPSSAASLQDIIFANDIANVCTASGFQTTNNGSASVDYVAFLGLISYHTARSNTLCYSGFSIYQPISVDNAPGTHIFMDQLFEWDSLVPNPCGGLSPPFDGEGFIFNNWDGNQGGPAYTQQAVMENSLFLFNGASGVIVASTTSPVYIFNVTAYGNDQDNNQNQTSCGEFLIDSVSTGKKTEIYRNLGTPSTATGCGGHSAFAFYVNHGDGTDHVYSDWAYSAAGNNLGTASSTGFAFGPNNTTGTDPALTNPVEPGPPVCSSFTNVPNCMATVITNFTPTNAAAKSYGYQSPGTASIYDPLYPAWLCTITNLPSGLVTPGCLAADAVTSGVTINQGATIQ